MVNEMEVPIKVISKVAGTSIFSRLRKYFSFLFVAYILKGLVPYIHSIDIGYAAQQTMLQKAWFLTSNFMHIFAQRIWLSDLNVMKYVKEIQSGTLISYHIILVRVEVILALVIIYKAMFGLRIPLIGIDISLEAFLCWWLNYDRQRAGFTFKLMIIAMIISPFLVAMALEGHTQNYYPFEGVYEFFRMIITQPQLYFKV